MKSKRLHYEGFVEDHDGDTLWARCIDLDKYDPKKKYQNEFRLHIPFKKIPKSEIPFVQEGAIFRLTIREEKFYIRFTRRKITQKQIDAAKKYAEEMFKKMKPLE